LVANMHRSSLAPRRATNHFFSDSRVDFQPFFDSGKSFSGCAADGRPKGLCRHMHQPTIFYPLASSALNDSALLAS
jgi:hypothetical protein